MLSLITTLITDLLFWTWLVVALASGSKVELIVLVLIWLITTSPVSQVLIAPLENRYKQPSILELRARGIKQVVVLVGGGSPQRGELNASALTPASSKRFLAAFELCARLGPDCKLICSGSSGPSAYLPTSAMMKYVASTIDPTRIVFAETESRTTAEHPIYVREYLEKVPFVLVTSAYHVPRAMKIFRDAQLNPIAYPVDYLYEPRKGYQVSDFLPSTDNLHVLEIAVREYFATLLYKFMKR